VEAHQLEVLEPDSVSKVLLVGQVARFVGHILDNTRKPGWYLAKVGDMGLIVTQSLHNQGGTGQKSHIGDFCCEISVKVGRRGLHVGKWGKLGMREDPPIPLVLSFDKTHPFP
jgi:hypothetical protein